MLGGEDNSITSASTTESMMVQTDKAMEQLIKDDLMEQGNGGDSDMDGKGKFLIDAFNDMIIECC